MSYPTPHSLLATIWRPFGSREIDSKMFKALYMAVGQTWVVLGWYLKHIETDSKHGMISDLES